jgi:hypothetical protein
METLKNTLSTTGKALTFGMVALFYMAVFEVFALDGERLGMQMIGAVFNPEYNVITLGFLLFATVCVFVDAS